MIGVSRSFLLAVRAVSSQRVVSCRPVSFALHRLASAPAAGPMRRYISGTPTAVAPVVVSYAKPMSEGRVLPVVTYPAESLRKKADPIADVAAPQVQQLAADLIATAAVQMDRGGCLGLAAPQVGASVRMMALRTPRFNNEAEVMAHRKAMMAQARAKRPSVGRSRSPSAGRRRADENAGGDSSSAAPAVETASVDGAAAAAAPTEAVDENAVRYHVCINPAIIDRSAATEYVVEGCVSLPDVATLVRRSRRITVSWTDVDGSERRALLEGMPAVAFQHELDHLDGVMQTDREVKTLPPPGAASSKGGLAYRSLRDAFEAAAQRANMEVLIYYMPRRMDYSLPGRNVNLLDDY